MSLPELLHAGRADLRALVHERSILGRLFISCSLSFDMELQTQTNWCWAATSVSVNRYYWPPSAWTQCAVANGELGLTGCCNAPVPTACNVPWYLDKALTRTANFVTITGVVGFGQVKAEIDAGRVVGARVGWSGGGGHFMVIYGYSTVVGTQYFDIDDPIYQKSHITVADFTNNYQGSGSWTHTYFTKSSIRIMPIKPLIPAEPILRCIWEERPLLDLKYGIPSGAADTVNRTVGTAHRVFTLGLDDLAASKPAPKLAALRVVEFEGDQPRAFFDVNEETARVQQMSAGSPYLGLFTRAVEQALTVAGKGKQEWELRLLRVPALNVEAVWMHSGKKDLVISLRSFGGLPEFQPIPLRDALVALRAAAKSLGKSDDTKGA